MILSDRVSGKVSVWGLLTAGILTLVALPGWSWAQQHPPPDGTKSGVASINDLKLGAGVGSIKGLELREVQGPSPTSGPPLSFAEYKGLELLAVQGPSPNSGLPLSFGEHKDLELLAVQVPSPPGQETTDARLQKLEAEIQRLSRLLEQPRDVQVRLAPVVNDPSKAAGTTDVAASGNQGGGGSGGGMSGPIDPEGTS